MRGFLERRTSLPARTATLLSLALATAFSVALVTARIVYSGTPFLGNPVWNLVLAWVPLGLAILVYDRHKRGARTARLLPLGALWLLFFPNAPYIVTDFGLLEPKPHVPLWFDVVTISAAAWTGLLLGFVSLYLIHEVARRRAGAWAGRTFVGIVLLLSGFGISLGRFERWNSWDVFVRPSELFGDVWVRVADPLSYPRTFGMTVVFAAFLALAYTVLASLTRLRLDLDR